VTTLPKPVQDAITTLGQARDALGTVISNGYGISPVIPGDVSTPTPKTISIAWTTKDYFWVMPTDVPQKYEGTIIQWPSDQYDQWQSAWAILMAYAGWWGARATWPLGDGVRAAQNFRMLGGLPTATSALTTLQTTLIVIQSPTWVPDVQWRAIASLGLFVVGGISAWFGADHVKRFLQEREGLTHNRAAMLGWNLGRFLYHRRR
jgi:hypothetical protein